MKKESLCLILCVGVLICKTTPAVSKNTMDLTANSDVEELEKSAKTGVSNLSGKDSVEDNLIFHFNFKDAAEKKEITDAAGNFKCISKDYDFVVQQNALRLAPCAKIYIPSEKLPDISREVTVSAWILKRSTPDVTPILMKGEHPDPIEFLFTIGWRYPAFCYKNIPRQWFWKGLWYIGDFGTRISYPKKSWLIPGSELIESSGYWKNVTAVFNKGDVKIYLNGELTAHAKNDKEEFLKKNDSPIYVGAERLVNEDLNFRTADMLLNDIRLYNKALSDKEVDKIFETDKQYYTLGCLIPKGETHLNALAPCEAYPFSKDYDPKFRKKLKITEEYEKKSFPNLKYENITEAVVEKINGMQALVINGQPEYPHQAIPASFKHSDGKYRWKETYGSIRDFAAAGVNKISLYLGKELWLGEGEYNWEKIDALIKKTIEVNPQIKIMLYIPLWHPPAWFAKKYPEELEEAYWGEDLRRNPGNGPLGSRKWLELCTGMLKDLVTHVESSDYAGHIYGYLPGGGQSAEWYWPGGATGGAMTGYSKATAQSFRDWLKNKYNNDNRKLQKAWGSKTVTFDTAKVPSVESRKKSENFIFRDPAKATQVFDFRYFMTDYTVMHITECARAIKEACGFKKIVAVYAGYPLTCSSKKFTNNGHQGTHRIFSSPYIDILATPITYSTRKGGQPGMNVNPFNGSSYLHNKIIWHENDIRTHLCTLVGRASTLAETITIFERGFGNALTRNAGVWWHQFDNAWFHQEDIMRTVAKIQKSAKESLRMNRESAAEVAFIFDEKSLYYLSYYSDPFIKSQNWKTYNNAARMGAPFDFYLLDDIKNKKMPDYKLYVFLNLFYVDAATRKTIAGKVRKSNAVSVWCYAPGFISDNGFSTKTMHKLTGIKLEELKSEMQTTLKITDKNSPITRFGGEFNSFKVGPLFYAADQNVKVLGTANEKPALVIKEFGKWKSVYSLMPLTKELLMGLCDYAGVHVYSRSFDVFSANKSHIMVHTSIEGEKVIKLPGKYDVREIFSGDIIGKNISIFSEKLSAQETRIYEIINAL